LSGTVPILGRATCATFEWHYLNRLCHQELLNLDGRSGPAYHVVFSPDGKRLASAGRGVKVWDAQTGRELLALEDALGPVAFSPDGKRLATCAVSDQGAAVKMWDGDGGRSPNERRPPLRV
jgi:WD40 repeat protein